jgi:acetyltransferase-like isoleucine patch superfamily enzyme
MSFRFKLKRSLPAEKKIAELKKILNLAQSDIVIGNSVEMVFNDLTWGQGIVIEDGTTLVCDRGTVGDSVVLGHSSDIRSTDLVIESGVRIEHHCRVLVGEKLQIRRNTSIGHSSELICRSAEIGEGFYGEHSLIMGGGGGARGPYSDLKIGRFVHVGEYSVLNTARPITIGDETGLGAHVSLYTHGMWPPALEGYPLTFGPISIGKKCWITGYSIVLPGVTIGEGAVVAMGSVVHQDLPPRCLAGGKPAKVLREGIYGNVLSSTEKDLILREVVSRYVPELEFKGFRVQRVESSENIFLKVGDANIAYLSRTNDLSEIPTLNGRTIIIARQRVSPEVLPAGKTTVFNLGAMEMEGIVDELSEDLRDFLRRNCIRFYTKERFESIQPPCFRRLTEA